MANLVAEASRVHAQVIRTAMRSGHYQKAENQLATMKHSYPIPYLRATPPEGTPSRLPIHTYVHDVLRYHQPLDNSLREVGWMLEQGIRVRERTIKAMILSALRKEGEEHRDALSGQREDVSKDALTLRGDMVADQHLGMAIEMLRLLRTNGYTGATTATVDMYKSVVDACLDKDEFVTAALVFEMMIEDWAEQLSTHGTTIVPSSPVEDIVPGEGPPHTANSALLTPSQFSDESHTIFKHLCVTLQIRFWASQPLPLRDPEDTEKAKQLQLHIAQAICILVSLIDRRLLPYCNIRNLLTVMYMCTRTPSVKVLVRADDIAEQDLHSYLRGVVTSFVEDLASTSISSNSEINEILRSRDLPLPYFDLESYRALLGLTYKTYHYPELARKVVLLMAKDDETRRISLDRETCNSLATRPKRLRMMGLDKVIYNYVWNKARVELKRPTLIETTPRRLRKAEGSESTAMAGLG